MNIDGLDALIAQLEDMHDDIDSDVDEIVKNNALDFSKTAKVTAREVMIKGYWTGNLAGLIKVEKNGNADYDVVSNAHYSGFVEFGTRFMEAEPFFAPTYKIIGRQLKLDLDRLINS